MNFDTEIPLNFHFHISHSSSSSKFLFVSAISGVILTRGQDGEAVGAAGLAEAGRLLHPGQDAGPRHRVARGEAQYFDNRPRRVNE